MTYIGAYIFVCSNATMPECVGRKLFGTNLHGELITQIKPGDTLFLYNYSQKTLFGPFSAAEPGQYEVCPEAWGGKFPYQVPVEPGKDGIHEIKKKDFEGFTPFESAGVPFVAVNAEATDKLLQLLSDAPLSKAFPADS